MKKFSKIVCDRLLYFVYVIKATQPYISTKITLGEVSTDQVVYVGKGKENRAFSHQNEQWYKEGNCVEEFISVQLTEETAFHVESALISTIGLDKLENKVLSLGSQTRLTIKDIIYQYDIDPLVLDAKDSGKSLLVIFEQEKTRPTLDQYDRVTRWWVVNKERAKQIKTILMMNKDTRKIDVVIENIDTIFNDPNDKKRYGFDNPTKTISINSKYLGKWAGHIRINTSNPIQYL